MSKYVLTPDFVFNDYAIFLEKGKAIDLNDLSSWKVETKEYVMFWYMDIDHTKRSLAPSDMQHAYRMWVLDQLENALI
jgi:hypothetical protein